MKQLTLLFSATLLTLSGSLCAQTKADTLVTKQSNKEESNRNVLLNASNDTGPRQISIGLPVVNPGDIIVLENDLPVVYHYWPHNPNTHWRADASLKRVGLLKLSEVQTTTGRVGYATNSYSRLGEDKFGGAVNYRVNHFGMQQFDINISGPMGKGWYYSGSIYQNFDPGSFKLKYTDYYDRTQIYKGIITKRFNDNRGEISALYKYSYSKSLSAAANTAPFIYNGDGSISEADGFKLGTDSYSPVDGKMKYMDIVTGEMKEGYLQDESLNKANEIGLMGRYRFDNGMDFKMSAKYERADASIVLQAGTGIIDTKDSKDTYTYLDGKPYTGKVQQRLSMIDKGTADDFMMMMELSRQSGRHHWRIGMNEWYNKTIYKGNSTKYQHEVKSYPEKLRKNGKEYYDYNTAGEYYDGSENRIAAYFTDEWNLNKKLDAYFGVRVEHFSLSGTNMPMKRYDGFHYGTVNPSNAEEKAIYGEFSHSWILPAVSLNLTYKMNKSFGFLGEVSYSVQGNKLSDYAGYAAPYTDAVSVPYGRLGVYYNNSWISLVSAGTYIKKTNFQSRFNLVDPQNPSQNNMYHLKYDVETLGWTTDIVLKPFKGAQLHALFTLQSPEYKNYAFEAYGQKYNFNTNQVVGVSKVLVELDPSYQITSQLRAWASFRYFSKQYGSISNVLYFSPRWETFGGVEYVVNKNLTLNALVVNFLNQTGASGTISGSELTTDASKYAGQWMSGNYLRPFTFEMKASIRF